MKSSSGLRFLWGRSHYKKAIVANLPKLCIQSVLKLFPRIYLMCFFRSFYQINGCPAFFFLVWLEDYLEPRDEAGFYALQMGKWELNWNLSMVSMKL